MNKIDATFKPFESLSNGTGKIFKTKVDGVDTFVRSTGLFSRIRFLRTPRATADDIKNLYENVKSLRGDKDVDLEKVEKSFATCINQFSSDSSLKEAAQKLREQENNTLADELAKIKEAQSKGIKPNDIQTVKKAKAWLDTLEKITLREEKLYVLFNDIQLALASQRAVAKGGLANKEIRAEPDNTSTTSVAARRTIFENRISDKEKKDKEHKSSKAAPSTPLPKTQSKSRPSEPSRSISDPRISETKESEHLSFAERRKMFNQGAASSNPTLLDKAQKSNLKVTASSGNQDFVVHDKAKSRFPKPEAVVKALMLRDSENSELNSLLRKRGIEGPYSVKGVYKKQVTGGQSQSHSYVIQMADGREFFCKVTNPTSSLDSVMQEKKSSQLISKRLGSDHNFIPMRSYLKIKQGQNNFDVMIYDKFDGEQLLKSDSRKTAHVLAKILGEMHAKQLKDPQEFSKLLIHPDFNTSNILVRADGEYAVVDNCDMYISRNEKEAYQNIHDALTEQIDKDHFFEVYASHFPESVRGALIAQIKAKVAEHYGRV